MTSPYQQWLQFEEHLAGRQELSLEAFSLECLTPRITNVGAEQGDVAHLLAHISGLDSIQAKLVVHTLQSNRRTFLATLHQLQARDPLCSVADFPSSELGLGLQWFYEDKDSCLYMLRDLLLVALQVCYEEEGTSRFVPLKLKVDELVKTQGVLPSLLALVEGHTTKIKALLSKPSPVPAQQPAQNSTDTQLDKIHAYYLQRERVLMTEIIFLIVYRLPASGTDTQGIVGLCSLLSSQMVDGGSSNLFQGVSHCLLALACCLDEAQTQDTSLETNFPSNWIQGMNLKFTATLQTQSNSLGSSHEMYEWTHDGVHGVVLLLWGLFLNRQTNSAFQDSSTAFIERAYQLRGLGFLCAMVRSPEMAHEQRRNLMVSMVDEIVVNILKSPSSRSSSTAPKSITTLGPSSSSDHQSSNVPLPRAHILEEFAARRDHEEEPSFMTDSLQDVLHLLSMVVRLEPGLADKYLLDTHNHAARFFVTKQLIHRVDTSNPDPYALYLPFLNLISALGSASVACARACLILLTKEKLLSTMYEMMDLYHKNFNGQEANPTQSNTGWGSLSIVQEPAKQRLRYTTIPPEDQLVLEAWMKVVSSLGQDAGLSETLLQGPTQRGGVYAKAWSTETCFELLQCEGVEMSLKGAIVKALAALCKSTSYARKLWVQMDQYQILKTHEKKESTSRSGIHTVQPAQIGFYSDASSSSTTQLISTPRPMSFKDVRQDFFEKETASHEYVYMVGYLDLVWSLLLHGSENGGFDHVGTHGILPYLRFVCLEVFVRFDQRAYAQYGQQWVMAASQARIFLTVLESFSLEDQDLLSSNQAPSPGFWLLSQLFQGGALLNKLCSVFVTCFKGLTQSLNANSRTRINALNPHSFNQGQRTDKDWFVVASKCAKSDVNSVAAEHPNVNGFGMIRQRYG